jgi:tetratricopeptide (TPR) repeat protein
MRGREPYYEGNRLYNSGKYKGAIKYYDLALEKNPNHSNALIGKGCALYKLYRYEESLECYEKVLNIRPRVPTEIELDALVGKGNVHYALNHYDESKECYERVLQINPRHINALIGIGFLMNLKRLYEECNQFLNKALKIHQSNQFALTGIASGLISLEKYEIANEYYDKALDVNPNSAVSLSGKAGIHYHKGDFKKYIEYLTKASDSDPEFAGPLLDKMVFFREQGEIDKAEMYYQSALKIDKKLCLLSRTAYGIQLCLKEEYDESIKIYSEIVRMDPEMIHAWVNMGIAYYFVGDCEKSIDCFDRALKIDPGLTLALYCKGANYRKLGDNNKYDEYYGRLLDIDPDFLNLDWIRDIPYVIHTRGGEYRLHFLTYDKKIINKLIEDCRPEPAEISDPLREDQNLMSLEASLRELAGRRIDQIEYINYYMGHNKIELETGRSGEDYVEYYLNKLNEDNMIKQFCWISDP